MMKNLSLLIIAVCTLYLNNSCASNKGIKGNGNISTESISINDFSKLRLQTSANVIYEQKENEAPFLSLEIDENLRQYVSAEVVNGVLVIKTSENLNSQRFNVYTNSKSLQQIENSSSGSIEIKGIISTPNLDLKTLGSGSIKAFGIDTDITSITLSGSGSVSVSNVDSKTFSLKLTGSGGFSADVINCADGKITVNGSGGVKINRSDSKDLSMTLTGSGSAKIEGIASDVSISTNGSGSVNASDLRTTNAKCKSRGSGGISIQVTNSLNAATTGSGSIRYSGNPSNVIQSSSGSGKIRAF